MTTEAHDPFANAPQPVMQDFVFSHLEADEQTLGVERSRWSGIRHRHDLTPLDPSPEEPVMLTVSVGRDVLVDHVTAYMTTDGSDPDGSRGVAGSGVALALVRAVTIWQPIYWDYAELWRVELPGQPEGVHVRYRIEGWHSGDGSVSHWSKEMPIDGSVETPAVYGYVVDRHQTPAWAREAVVYQVFVDRFAPLPARWLEPGELSTFAGGTLQGVSDHLDYIAGLGATAIWLTPIFVTDSYHGYDTIDYLDIDPRFGSKADLRSLVAGAHQRGLRVILDFVTNHTSQHFPVFQAAQQDQASPYRSWYSFGPEFKHGYRTFFTSRSMPQLDLDNPGARGYLLDAARYWLQEFGVDGYRLDYAAGPSHDFWSAFGAACRQAKPDCWLFGEVTMGSDWLRTYSGRLDGCLDFSFTKQVRRLCTGPSPLTISQFAAAVERTQRFFPDGFTRPAFLDNHDMNRFLWVAGNDKQRLRLAAGLLFAFGGTPILYYGTEVGLSQPRGKGPHREESRHPMLWGEQQDAELLAYFRRLIAFRRQHPSLVYGDIRTLHLDDEHGVWLASRGHGADRTLIAVNSGNQQVALALPATELPPYSVTLVEDRLHV